MVALSEGGSAKTYSEIEKKLSKRIMYHLTVWIVDSPHASASGNQEDCVRVWGVLISTHLTKGHSVKWYRTHLHREFTFLRQSLMYS